MFTRAKPIKKPDDPEHAYNYALFLLNIRFRTDREMRDKMKDRGYQQDIIDQTLTRLVSERLIDDDRYATNFIENMKSYKQYGFFMMKKKLIERKLAQELIEAKLEELVTIEDERKITERLVQKEFGSLQEIQKLPFDSLERQKVMRRLQARGFRVSSIL